MKPAPPRSDTKSLPATHWTLLQQIQSHPPGSARAQAALQQLRELYGSPVLAALQHVLPRQRYPNVDAAQLTQEFLASLANATPVPEAGHSGMNFRSWLKQQLSEFCKQCSARLDPANQQAAPSESVPEPVHQVWKGRPIE